MFKVGISGFRVFERIEDVELRPITILTGGNSSGKTSFMAAIRLLSDLASRDAAPVSFNKDPFYLGSYDQIAHHRGGRYGRVKHFSFKYCGIPLTDPLSHGFRKLSVPLPEWASISIDFRKRLGQPALSGIEYVSDASTLSFQYSDDWQSATASGRIGTTVLNKVEARRIIGPDQLAAQSMIISAVIEGMFYTTADGGRDASLLLAVNELTSHFRAALAMMPNAGFVGAPVRTKPLRTYDPTESATQSEGSHVPSHMAQLARTSPRDWTKIRTEIVNFGVMSGLFSDLEVRTLGRGDSDPFQLNIGINGPKRNIVDVGYGVSQAIPIVFELAQREEGSLYIMQQPEVHLHPEAQAALATYVVSSVRDKFGYVILETHSDFLIDRVRRHVREGIIDPEQVSLLYFKRHEFSSDIHAIEIDKQGELSNPPDGYRAFFLKEQIENLGF